MLKASESIRNIIFTVCWVKNGIQYHFIASVLTEGCSQCGWDVSRHASSRADFPGVRRKCWKMERKWGIWWVDDAKVTHYMLFQEVRLGYFTSWVLKGTGTPRQERVCALRSFSVPRIPRRKYSNRLLILTVCSLNCMFQY